MCVVPHYFGSCVDSRNHHHHSRYRTVPSAQPIPSSQPLLRAAHITLFPPPISLATKYRSSTWIILSFCENVILMESSSMDLLGLAFYTQYNAHEIHPSCVLSIVHAFLLLSSSTPWYRYIKVGSTIHLW